MFSIISVDSAYHSSLFQMFSKHEFNFSNEDKLNKKSLRQRGKMNINTIKPTVISKTTYTAPRHLT